MILSVSRRTDIPAFYFPWFIRRLREGYVYYTNPFRPRYLYEVPLSPANIECIVFWTKNPSPVVSELSTLDSFGIPYYFLFTITPYGKDLEPGVPETDRAIELFKLLTHSIGKHRVVWRYDPILINNRLDYFYHKAAFQKISRNLKGNTTKCIVSFFQPYKKNEKRMAPHTPGDLTVEEKRYLLKDLKGIAEDNNIEITICADAQDYFDLSIPPSGCINNDLVSQLSGNVTSRKTDNNQRKHCSCIKSIDIGAYNTCMHGCLYCYATGNTRNAVQHHRSIVPASPILAEHAVDDVEIRRIVSESDIYYS